MARDVIQPMSGFEEQLRPQAEPISTYVRPPEPAPSQLHGLADALSNFSHSIGGMLKDRQGKQDEKDKYLGEAAALKANGVGYAEAVKSGAISPTNSPLFIASYKEAQGSIVGKRLASGAADAYQTWGGRNSQDPNDFDNFLGQYINQGIGSISDPDVLKGALPHIESMSSGLITANEKERSDSLYSSSVNAHIASSSMDIDAFDDNYLSTGGTEDYGNLWSNLMREREVALGSGIRAEDYDASMTQMITSKAMEHMDPGLLGMLSNKVPGKDYKYSDTPDGQKALNETTAKMETRWNQIQADKAQQQAAEDSTKKDAQTAFVIDQLAKDPATVFDPAFIAEAQKLDPTLPVKIKEWSGQLATGLPEDDADIMAVQQKILNGGGMEAINSAMAQGVIHDPSTLSSLYNLNNSMASNDTAPIRENQTVKDAMQYLTLKFRDDELTALDPMAVTPESVAARTDFMNSMNAWYKANPNATYDQISNQAAVTMKRVAEGGGGLQSDSSANYQRPPAVQEQLETPPAMTPQGTPNVEQTPRDAPASPLVPSQQTAQEVQNNEREPKPDTDVWSGPAAPTLDQLPEDQRNKINDRAKQLGIDPNELVKGVYERRQAFVPPDAYTTPSLPNPPGLVEKGTINLDKREAMVDNKDGSYSTVATMSFEEDGKEVLIPTIIPDGKGGWKHASDEEAEDYYHETGLHLGKFDTAAQADAYAEKLHDDQAEKYDEQVDTKDEDQGDAAGAIDDAVPLKDRSPTSASAYAGGEVPKGQPIRDPTFEDASFKTYAASIKGMANRTRSGALGDPGNPRDKDWQQKNITQMPVTLANGKTQLVPVNRKAATAFHGFLKDLQATGYKVDNVGAWVLRDSRDGSKLSEHAYGTAIDINGMTEAGAKGPRNAFSKDLVTDLPPNIALLAAKWGLSWGGDWKSKKDAMHFEYTGTTPPTLTASR